MFFFILKMLGGCLVMMKKFNKAWVLGKKFQEIPTNRMPQSKSDLSWVVGSTSKDELLQRIKMRFEKSKDLVVRACLGVVDVSWPSFFFLVNLLGG